MDVNTLTEHDGFRWCSDQSENYQGIRGTEIDPLGDEAGVTSPWQRLDDTIGGWGVGGLSALLTQT